MSCFFRHCCGDGTANGHAAEKFKHGAFVSPEVYESTRIKASPIQYMHKPIPWVRNAKFQDNYELGERLGVGAFGVVYDAIRRTMKNNKNNKSKNGPSSSTSTSTRSSTPRTVHQILQQQQQQQVFAVKIMPRQAHLVHRQQLQALVNEVQILADLRHPNVVRLVELYKDPTYFFLVLEKLNGGELFDKMCQRQCYTEKDARDVCRTLFDAMAYCHKHRVAHRDMKPENLLLQNYDTTSNDNQQHHHHLIKVCDFGFAKFVERPNSLITLCGTAAYMAPEILNYQPYDQRVDNWSVGVILFMLLGGYAPFDEHRCETNHNKNHGPPNNNTTTTNNNIINNNRYRLNQQIRQGHYIMHPQNWDGVSPDAKALIKGLLTVNMKQRLTMEQALEHPWMTGHSDDFLKTKCLSNNLQQFKRFQEERKERQQKLGGGTSSGGKSVSYYWLLSRS